MSKQPSEPDRQIALPIVGKPDARERMYGKIALVHSQVQHAQRLAKLQGGPFMLKPAIVVHLEESVAFLAEETLRNRKILEMLAHPVCDEDGEETGGSQ